MREEVAAPAKGVIGLAEGPQGTPLIIQAAQSRGCVRAHTALFRAAARDDGADPARYGYARDQEHHRVLGRIDDRPESTRP